MKKQFAQAIQHPVVETVYVAMPADNVARESAVELFTNLLESVFRETPTAQFVPAIDVVVFVDPADLILAAALDSSVVTSVAYRDELEMCDPSVATVRAALSAGPATETRGVAMALFAVVADVSVVQTLGVVVVDAIRSAPSVVEIDVV